MNNGKYSRSSPEGKAFKKGFFAGGKAVEAIVLAKYNKATLTLRAELAVAKAQTFMVRHGYIKGEWLTGGHEFIARELVRPPGVPPSAHGYVVAWLPATVKDSSKDEKGQPADLFRVHFVDEEHGLSELKDLQAHQLELTPQASDQFLGCN